MGWHLLLILLCRHSMDPPFADVLSPIVWKRSRLSFLPPSSLLLYPFPYGLFMQIQDEESINSMVWSSPHTYTKKANSFSLHGNGEEGDGQAPRKSGLSAFLSIRGEHLAPFPSRLSSIESIRSKCARKGISGEFKRKTFVSREKAHIPKISTAAKSHDNF